MPGAFVTIRMDAEVLERLDKAAKADDRTHWSWIRKVILAELSRIYPKASPNRPKTP